MIKTFFKTISEIIVYMILGIGGTLYYNDFILSDLKLIDSVTIALLLYLAIELGLEVAPEPEKYNANKGGTINILKPITAYILFLTKILFFVLIPGMFCNITSIILGEDPTNIQSATVMFLLLIYVLRKMKSFRILRRAK